MYHSLYFFISVFAIMYKMSVHDAGWGCRLLLAPLPALTPCSRYSQLMSQSHNPQPPAPAPPFSRCWGGMWLMEGLTWSFLRWHHSEKLFDISIFATSCRVFSCERSSSRINNVSWGSEAVFSSKLNFTFHLLNVNFLNNLLCICVL